MASAGRSGHSLGAAADGRPVLRQGAVSPAAVANRASEPAHLNHSPYARADSLLEHLRDVVTLLAALPGPRKARVARIGSVGEHVRHCLDHVSALVSAIAGDELSYDPA